MSVSLINIFIIYVTWLIFYHLLSIIAVHGLNGDPTNTWKHPANNHFWLQHSLPLDVKGARVLNYGYNADVVFGNSTADVWDHAKDLLGSLIDERETEHVRGIGHIISYNDESVSRTLYHEMIALIFSVA